MNTANALIRLAAPTDLASLKEVYRRSSLSNEGDRAALLEHLDVLEFSPRAVHEHRVRVAVIDDRVIGFATILAAGQIGELEDLFVDPDWMRRGVARSLVLDALDIAREHGLTRIEVTANPHALGFYEKVGFVSDGITQTRFGPGPRMHLLVPPERRCPHIAWYDGPPRRLTMSYGPGVRSRCQTPLAVKCRSHRICDDSSTNVGRG